MKTRTDAHDDVALRDEETITWWAMMHNMDDDRVPCSGPNCQQEAHWVHHCTACNRVRYRCIKDAHETKPGAPFIRCSPTRGGCGALFDRVEWYDRYLPM